MFLSLSVALFFLLTHTQYGNHIGHNKCFDLGFDPPCIQSSKIMVNTNFAKNENIYFGSVCTISTEVNKIQCIKIIRDNFTSKFQLLQINSCFTQFVLAMNPHPNKKLSYYALNEQKSKRITNWQSQHLKLMKEKRGLVRRRNFLLQKLNFKMN